MEYPLDPGGRPKALGHQLIEVHLLLREQLAELRADVESFLDGRAGKPRSLRAHCLAFCSAVTRHHTGEDGEVFPALAQRFPELRPVLDELARDHRVVTGMLAELETLLGGLRRDAGPAEVRRVRAELDGLSALLESHFGYEEKRIASALDAVAARWQDTTPSFLDLRPGRP
ncbi:hemerythrin domain-containing protein [Amycolatopsis sp. NPDC059021]|uniref:hemerythrin domain-containing protein n=1 Tax=Amycolatopsis sp. NPDC059021 TaxID=3346704 RepID=UPI00366BBDD7